MNKHYFLLWMVVMHAYQSYGQDYFYNDRYYDQAYLLETGLGIGAMNCFTDLGGGSGPGKKSLKDLNWINFRPAAEIHFSILYKYSFSVGLEVRAGTVRACDSILSSDQSEALYRYQRNLSFRSRIAEVSLTSSWFPLTMLNASLNKKRPSINPYLKLGIGIFHFNPEGQLEGRWYKLKPLHTEGQGFPQYPERLPYSLFQLNYQIGFGAVYEISALVNLRWEMCYRVLKTDYLDDVSTVYIDPTYFDRNLSPPAAKLAKVMADRQGELNAYHKTIPGTMRGGSTKNDSYFTCMITVGYILNRAKK